MAEQSHCRYSEKNGQLVDNNIELRDVTFSHQSLMRSSESMYVVKVYNDFFNAGKDESTNCYPCVRHAVAFITRLVVLDAPIVFDTDDILKVYTCYDHPLDFPNAWVVICWITQKGNPTPRAMSVPFMVTADYDKISNKMRTMGLWPMERQPEDDPKIFKTYI